LCYIDSDMNAADTLEKTETAFAALSGANKKKLLRRLYRQVSSECLGIERNEDVMGGAACIRDTRIPVWMLYHARQLGMSESDMLGSYPGLTAEDLVNAWDYAALNRDEIELQIQDNEKD